MDDEERLMIINNILNTILTKYISMIEIVSAKKDGQIIARLKEPLSADSRGTLLLDLEEDLKKYADNGVIVWLEALNDKSPLRRLRGIEVKA